MDKLDDIATYRKVADEAYTREQTKNALNPRAVQAAREAAATAGPPVTTTKGFTKGFSPAERAAQEKQKQELLKKRGDL